MPRPPIRVLVVDDAVVVRRLVSRILEEHPAFAVPSTAVNGRMALVKVAQAMPDAIVLDIEMPEMDGLTAIREIRLLHPRLPIIMFSTVTELGAEATLQALALGATDYVRKPSNAGGFDAAIAAVRAELVPKLLALTGRSLSGRRDRTASPLTFLRPTRATDQPAAHVAPRPPRGPAQNIEIVALAASTGGPNALATVLERLGVLPVPVVVTQHIPPVFSKMLAQRLDKLTPMPVREAATGEHLLPGTVWIAPGDHHLVIRRAGSIVELVLDQGAPVNSCRPAVDVMFRSVADVFGGGVLAVMLTGMGADGARGAQQLHDLGAQIIAQDRASSVVWGMPGAVVGAGLADAVVPLDGIADEMRSRVAPSTVLAST